MSYGAKMNLLSSEPITKDIWASIRKKGLPYLIIHNGFLFYGVMVGFLFMIYKLLKNINYNLAVIDVTKFSWSIFTSDYLSHVIISLFCGVVITVCQWFYFESKYNHDREENENL